jgi:hypothetical protein
LKSPFQNTAPHRTATSFAPPVRYIARGVLEWCPHGPDRQLCHNANSVHWEKGKNKCEGIAPLHNPPLQSPDAW